MIAMGDNFQHIEIKNKSEQSVKSGVVAEGNTGLRQPAVFPHGVGVTAKRPRRRFSAQYKLHILAKADSCSNPGEIAILLEQEGLYAANLSTWRRLRRQGLLNAMQPRKRGRKSSGGSPLAKHIIKLEKENLLLQQKLKQAQIIIVAQKKVVDILDSSPRGEEEPQP